MRVFGWPRLSKSGRFWFILGFLGLLYFVFAFVFKTIFFQRNVKLPGNAAYVLHYAIPLPDSTERNSTCSISGSFERNCLPRNSSVQGFNVHMWALACEVSLQKFVEHPLFPTSPNVQSLVDTLDLKWNEANGRNARSFGLRIFGFMFAPFPGSYSFLTSPNSNVSVWLKVDKKWQDIGLVSNNEKKNVSSNQKEKVLTYNLKENLFYFVEITQILTPQNSFYLKWKKPRSKNFENIPKKYLYSFMKESLGFQKFVAEVSCTPRSYTSRYPVISILPQTRWFISNIEKYVKWSDVQQTLPMCSYQPGYVGKQVLYEYHVVEQLVNPSYVYPEVKHKDIKDGKWIPWFPLHSKEANDIVKKYMKHLEVAYPGKYTLKEVLNVEKKIDWTKDNQVYYKGLSKQGNRFLLELLLFDNTSSKNIILSEYVYQHDKNETLCYPEGLQWNKSVPVYLLISIRKQAAWMRLFIRNMERVHKITSDDNLYVIVYDYNSTDIDIEAEFRWSSFKNFNVLKAPDTKYSRTYSLNRAAEVVTDPDAIISTLDMHLEIPPSFPNNVRKHCIKGKMVYTPIITRLACGALPQQPAGSWDPWGYGMFGAYKMDWDKFKGFDEVKFKTNWGGEDWDLVDRAYKVGLEFERIKHPDFYHYHHSRVGLWT